MRPPEPTITPQTMRAGFQQYVEARFAEQGGEFIDQLLDTTKRLMPRNRVDAIDLLEQFPLRYNGLGVMEASESVTKNYLIERGLAEGWMSVDSDLALMYNRKLAFDFDRNEYAVKQASALDEAAEIERYNARLWRRRTDPATQQGALNPAGRAGQNGWLVSMTILSKAKTVRLVNRRLVKMGGLIRSSIGGGKTSGTTGGGSNGLLRRTQSSFR